MTAKPIKNEQNQLLFLMYLIGPRYSIWEYIKVYLPLVSSRWVGADRSVGDISVVVPLPSIFVLTFSVEIRLVVSVFFWVLAVVMIMVLGKLVVVAGVLLIFIGVVGLVEVAMVVVEVLVAAEELVG